MTQFYITGNINEVGEKYHAYGIGERVQEYTGPIPFTPKSDSIEAINSFGVIQEIRRYDLSENVPEVV